MRMRCRSGLRRAMTGAGLAVILASAGLVALTGAPPVGHPAQAQVLDKPPGESLGNTSDSDLWRTLRKGVMPRPRNKEDRHARGWPNMVCDRYR